MKLKTFNWIFIGGFLLAACTRTKSYHCKEGTDFTVVLTHHHAQLRIQNKVFELNQKRVYEGTKYTDGKITFGTKDSLSFVFDADQMVDYGCVER